MILKALWLTTVLKHHNTADVCDSDKRDHRGDRWGEFTLPLTLKSLCLESSLVRNVSLCRSFFLYHCNGWTNVYPWSIHISEQLFQQFSVGISGITIIHCTLLLILCHWSNIPCNNTKCSKCFALSQLLIRTVSSLFSNVNAFIYLLSAVQTTDLPIADCPFNRMTSCHGGAMVVGPDGYWCCTTPNQTHYQDNPVSTETTCQNPPPPLHHSRRSKSL